MKKSTWILVLCTLLAALLMSACGRDSDSSPGDIPSQDPAEEPYPGPPILPTNLAGNPYPEPDIAGPIPPPTDHEYAPASGDEDLSRGEVFIDSVEVVLLESYPVQVHLSMHGNLPTPCHQLRAVVSPPNGQNRIKVEVYSLVDPETICTQVLEPFEAAVPLGAYTEGSFTVWLDGGEVGDFELP